MTRTRARAAAPRLTTSLLILCAALSQAPLAAAQEPRSVIPWLQGEDQPVGEPIQPAQPGDARANIQAPPIPDGAAQPASPQLQGATQGAAPVAAGAQDDALPTFAAPGPNDPARVEVAALGPVGVGAAGTLTPAEVGLPKDAWRGTDAATAVSLIESVAPSDLHAANRLAVRLLSAAFTPPSDGAAVFNARIAALSRFGAVGAATSIGETAGVAVAVNEPAWRAAALVSGRDAVFCQEVVDNGAPAGDLENIYCRARLGDAPTALLLIQTQRSLGGADPQVLDLLEAVADPTYTSFVEAPGDASAVTPLELAALRVTGVPLPAGFGDTAPLVLMGAVPDVQASPRETLAALERLEAAGALETAGLRTAYDGAASAESGGLWGRVEVYRRVIDGGGAAQLTNAAAALAKADEAGREAQMARLLAPTIAGSPVEGDAQTRRLLRLGGELGEASRRMTGAESPEERGLDRVANRDALSLWALQDAAPLTAKTVRGDQVAGRQLAALIAFGLAVPDPQLYPGRNDLSFVLADGRHAEVAFEALSRLRAGSAAPPEDLNQALRALLALGLDAEARQIAVEATLLGR
ncbi:MAG: hypothetical protein AAFR28_13070 [Pseudomonadota bacterium]